MGLLNYRLKLAQQANQTWKRTQVTQRAVPKIKDVPKVDSLKSSKALAGSVPLPLLKNQDQDVSPDILAKRADPHWQPIYPSPPSRIPIDLSFENYKECYQSKTTGEIVRALLVLNLCRISWIGDHSLQLIRIARKTLGKKLFEVAMKATFYGHFVGGEDPDRLKPLVERLRQFGVKSILDYSAEEDVSSETASKKEMSIVPQDVKEMSLIEEQSAVLRQFNPSENFGDRRRDVISARTYLYENEVQCEKHMATFLKCIDAVSGTTYSTGFAAIKLTALGRPELLMRLSAALVESRRYFNHILGLDEDTEPMVMRRTKVEDFKQHLLQRGIVLEKPEIQEWLGHIDTNRDGMVDLFEWGDVIDQTKKLDRLLRVPIPFAPPEGVQFKSLLKKFTDEDEEMFYNMMRRLKIITEHAVSKEVRMMIDAEQTYFQPAISRLTIELMRRYNRDKAYVFNTYQCYLKNTYQDFITHLELSRKEDFFFGAKIVRGAYIKQERDRSAELHYPDPTQPDFESTTENYEKVVETALEEVVARGIKDRKVAIMMATHNEGTVRFTVQKMKELGIAPADRVMTVTDIVEKWERAMEPGEVSNFTEGVGGGILSMFSGQEDGVRGSPDSEAQDLIRRMETIAKHAHERNVRVLVDAEQTYFQPAIARLSLELMRRYNLEKQTIYNTYQGYLKRTLQDMTAHLSLSKKENFHFGGKIVRGAYIVLERERASSMGYPDPINPTFEATTAMYKSVVRTMLEDMKAREGKTHIVIAGHNEETVQWAVSEVRRLQLPMKSRQIYFGQLLGMCDHLSFTLADAGFNVVKCVPYGSVDEVLPYLVRRAQENRGFLEKTDKEWRLMWEEFRRRLKSGELMSNHDTAQPAGV